MHLGASPAGLVRRRPQLPSISSLGEQNLFLSEWERRVIGPNTAANRLSHTEFLELILHDEVNVREQRKITRRTVAAEFTTLKSLDDFDWRFNESAACACLSMTG